MWGRNKNAPMETFKYSLVYLAALFVVMLVTTTCFRSVPYELINEQVTPRQSRGIG